MDLKKINLIKKILAFQEIKTVAADCEQDTKLIPFFSFPDTDEILQNFTSNSSISPKKAYSDSKNKVIFDFKPNNQVLLRIYQNSNWDDIIITNVEINLQVLYSKYTLFSFAKIFIDDDPNFKSSIFIPLIQAFTKLKKIKNANIQALLNEAFSYLFLEFLHSFDKKSFELIFPSLSDFLFSESYDNQIFSLIPEILHILIREYGFDFDSITAKFASLIQMILVDKLTNAKLNKKSNKTDFESSNEYNENLFNNENEEISEETMIVQKIFNCCQPFFLKLTDCALNLLCYLPKFLDENKIDAFFFQFPFCFEQFIESEEKPFVSVPLADKIYQFNPIQSPSSLSQFYDNVITFPKGLPFYDDIENSKNQDKNIPYLISDKYKDHFKFELKLNNHVDNSDLSSKLLPFMSSELISKIITVLKILDDNKEKYSLKHTILNSFCELIKLKKDSPKVFDYVTLFIHILMKLPGNENDDVPFPTSILFDPSYIVTPELHLLRLCSIGVLLNFDLKTLESLLKEVIKYPLIITEIGLIFNELGDLFSKNLLKSFPNKFFRIFKEIGAVYQYEDIHSECDRELIETPRIILLSLLSKEFQYKEIAEIVMKDTITIHFFLSHLFEVNLQPFMFKQLSLYIANNNVSDEFVQMLNQLFMQIVQLMPNKKGIKLITNLLSVIIKNSRNLKSFMILNDALFSMIDKLEIKKIENETDEESNLDLSWKFMDKTFTLLISYSMSNIKIPQRIFDSIERVLVKFSLLSEESIDFIDNSSKSKSKVAALNIKIFEKLIQLLSGTFISKYELIFDTAIVNFEVLKILFTVFQNSEIINIFNFCLKFCCFSNLNCIECRNCGFDSLLLNYIQNNREEFKYTRNISNLKKNPENVFLRSNSDSNLDSNEIVSSNVYIALMTVFEIMSIASSPSIVQQVISLFTPVNNHYITHLHPVLVKKIEEMLINEKNSPNITISLIQPHSFKLSMETNFTFICWIYVDSSVEATLLNIKCGDFHPFLSIAIGKQLIYVNKICSFVQVPKNRWVFLTVSFINNNQSNFSVELGLESIIVKRIDNIHVDDEIVKLLTSIDISQKSNNNDLPFTAVIGGNGSNSGRIGNFAILPLIDLKTMNNIFSNGPRSNEKESIGCVPFYYADDVTLRKLNMSSINYQSEEKTFSSILLNSFEIETFLPLFAQLDFTFISEDKPILTFKATDLANLLKAAFAASSIQRNQDFDFSILAHILINSNTKHLTCELYKIFYSIYIQHLISINSLSDSSFVTESNQQFLRCLMNKIITNFELWYPASAEEHEKIIDFIKEQKIISFLPQLLIILRMYYWYEPLLKLSSSSPSLAFNMNNAGISKHFVEHGLPDTERPRDPNLNIKKCRRALLSIFLPESNQDITRSMNLIPIETEDSNQSLTFSENNSMNYIKTKSNSASNLNPVERNDILNEDDFVLIVGHCILIITTTRDPYQVYDLLDFLQHAKFSYISTEKLFLLHKLLLNELSDDTVICMTIGVIISMHKQIHYTNGFNISKHIEIIFSIVSRRPLSGNSSSFLESLIGMLNECPDLFELCSFLSMQRKESILYHRIKPNPMFCSRKTWAFWAVINSMIISPKNDEKKTNEDEFESSFILNFLIRCHADDECWFNIFDSIRIASLVFTGFHYFDHRTRFLALLGNYVLKNSSNLSESCIEAAFMMIAFSILFRKHLKSDPISKQLQKMYNQSPFYYDEQFFKTINKKDKINFDNFAYPYEICDVLHAQSENGIKVDLTFGLKIDDVFHWVDSNLAELALSISIRFRGKKFYKASILIASFLLSSSYGKSTESGYHKFIQWWFDEMNFSMKDKETNADFFNFFYGKFNGTQAQIPDWNNLTQVIDWDLVLSHTIGLVDSLNKQFGNNNPYSDNNILFLKEISSSYSQSSSLVLPSDLPDSLRKQKQNLQNSFSINYLFDSSYSDEFCLEIDKIIHKIVESIAQFREDGMKRWEMLWSNMTLIGGAWNFSCAHNKEITENKENNDDEPLDTLDNIAKISSSNKNISDSKPKWKREFVMTSFYCPMKLKKNKRFNPHIEASITREIGNYSNAKQLVRAYRGRIEDQYRQQTHKTLLSLSDEFEQALNRSTSVKTVLKSKEENNNNLNYVKRSLSMPKMEQNENDNVMLISNDPMSEVDDTRTSADLTSSQSSPTSSIASSHFLFKQQLKQQKKLKKESKKSSNIKCELIKATKDVLGIFSINEKDLFILISPPSSLLISSNFVSPTTTTEKVVATKTYRIPIRRISEIFMRKRFQHSTAIEIFCIDGKSYFINFKDKETSIKAVENISKCIKYSINNNNNENKVENLDLPLIFKSSLINQNGTFLKLIQKNYNFIDFFEQQQYTTKWVEGEMSNFEYLIKLNIFSGRSFTDLSLYPIFPWIISKFDCKELNLNDPEIFRDLTKPIGAIGEDRLNELIERMEEMKFADQQMRMLMRRKSKPVIRNNSQSNKASGNGSMEQPPIGSSLMNLNDNFEEPYLYFSYVICPLAVFLYLIRMEPFTTLHIKMQSNKFDHGSRIFSSISGSYNSAVTSLNNYRELPPDFFFSPEVLVNENGFDLGKNKRGIINDVELPKWVHFNDSFEFVYILRKALESDYVSSFLPDWIDLMWGYKQKGEEAIKSNNIYSSQLYDNVWETHPKTLKNPMKKAEIEATLCHVGQIPPQLFREKHPKREIKVDSPLFSNLSLVSISNDEQKRNENVISAFISFEKDNIIHLSISSTYESTSTSTISLKKKKNRKLVSTRKIDFMINDDKSVRILKESDYFVKNLNQNSASCVKFFADESCFLLLGGKLFHPFGVSLQEKVSSVAFNDGYMAAVVDNDSTVLLFGPEITEDSSVTDNMNNLSNNKTKESNSSFSYSNFVGKPIKFYGEKVVCCDISYTFKVVVCGTSSGHFFICSLFNSNKINVVNLNENYDKKKNEKDNKSDIFVPRKIMVSKAWGFIVCYAESVPRSISNDRSNIEVKNYDEQSLFNLNETFNNDDGFDSNFFDSFDRRPEIGVSLSSRRHSIFVFNINGRFLRKIDIGFRLSSWCTWMSHKSFDYVALGTDDGRLLAFEAYSLAGGDFIDNKSDIEKWKTNGSFVCLFSDQERAQIVSCSEKKGTVVGVTADCRLVFAPIPSDFV